MGLRYIQHNPQAADGTEAFIGFVRAFPELSVDIRNVFADGDIVVTHSLDEVHGRGPQSAEAAASLWLPRRARSGLHRDLIRIT